MTSVPSSSAISALVNEVIVHPRLLKVDEINAAGDQHTPIF